MEMKIEFISKAFIKPSSPTPHHLSKLHFSFIDQNQTIVSLPYVLFFANSNVPNFERYNLLKHSLSEALTIFYPLAGRINNYSYADCNDEGALFIEAKANSKLSDILQNRNQYHKYTKNFIPLQPHKGINQYGSLFQITYLNCGGLVVSFAMPHLLGDAVSQMMFLNSWTAIARGNTVDTPLFGFSSIFPPRKLPGFDIKQWAFKENLVTKSFVFDASTISALRDKYSDSHENMSRVQALTVFLTSRMIATISRADNSNRCMVFNAVNLRPFLDLPTSKQYYGNILWPASAVIDKGKEDEIPRRIKDSFKSVNKDFVKKIQSENELNFGSEISADWLKGEIDKYTYTSLCNFPIYDLDFGWGKPAWAAANGMVFDNLVIFVDTKEGRGIEAWINMTEEDMAKFEKDKVFLSHLSSTPNGNPKFSSCL